MARKGPPGGCACTDWRRRVQSEVEASPRVPIMAQFLPLLEAVAGRVAPPVALVLGAPRLVVELVSAVPSSEVVCYQMDLFQADRLREELAATALNADVKTAPDLWDLPADFQTVIFPSP